MYKLDKVYIGSNRQIIAIGGENIFIQVGEDSSKVFTIQEVDNAKLMEFLKSQGTFHGEALYVSDARKQQFLDSKVSEIHARNSV